MFATPSLQSGDARRGISGPGLVGIWAGALLLFGVMPGGAQSSGQLQFSASSYTVVESEGFATISVRRLGGTDGVVTVDYATTNGTAVAGQDYLSKAGTLTFAAGQTNKNFTILLFDNTITNTTRTIGLVIGNPTGGASLGALSTATLILTDNDAESDTVGFSVSTYAVNENGGSAIVVVTREGARTQTVSVDYATLEGGGASPGLDFTPVTGTLFFNPGQASASFAIPIIDDGVVGEGDETVLMELANPSPTNLVALGRSFAVLSIQENDFSQSTFIFSQAGYVGFEGGTNATITVTRAGANVGIATVDFFTSDGSATAFQDYFPRSGTLTFTNQQRFASFAVPIINDLLLDDGETVLLTLTNATGGAVIGRTNATLTIADDDAAFRFSTDRYVVDERGTNVVVTVLREGGTNGTATVMLQTSDGTNASPALSAFDYTGSFPTLTFTNGQTFATFAIPILDDLDVEADESFYVSLSGPNPGQLSVPFNAEVVILDNDTDAGTFSFNFVFGTNDLREGIFSTITLFVDRQGGSSGAVSVGYFPTFNPNLLCPGTDLAELGFDFSGGSGTLNWADGDSGLKSFSITVIDDDEVELDEIISIQLVNPTGGAAISSTAGETTATIIFQDPPPGAADQFHNFRGPSNPNPGANNTVNAVAIYQSAGGFLFNEGKAIIAGEFTGYNATVRNRIARVNVDGLIDPTFDPGAGANGFINSVVIQPDDKVLLGGGFTSIDNISRHGIARLDEFGALDSTFDPGTGVDGVVLAVALRPNGTVVIGGLFSEVDGIPRNNIALLGTDGSVILDFDPGLGVNDAVLAIAVQPDNRVILGGDFTSVNGVSRNRIARLDETGALDTTFTPVSGADNSVRAVAVQSDGRILIGGTFTMVNGIPWSGIARLNSDGSTDTQTFNPGAGISGGVNSIALQGDQRPLLAGAFVSFDGISRTNVARLNQDGTLDTGFLDNYYNQRQPGPNGFVNAVAVFPRIVGQTFFTNMIGTNVFIFTNSVSIDEVYIGGAFDRIGGGNTVDDVLEKRNFARLIGGDIEPFFNMPGNISFVGPTASVDENVLGGFASVSLQRENGILGRVRVSYETYDISARAGVDYEAVSGTFFWDSCDGLVKTFNIPIIDNALVEGNRTFGVRVFDPVGTGIFATNQPALGFNSSASVLILDNDFERGSLGFSGSVYYIGEDQGSAIITVTRTNGSSGSATVQYTTLNQSAVAPGDYGARSGVLFFGAGETSKTFTVPIVNDTAVEFEETAGLRLFNASGGVDLRADASTATLAITDNDNGPGSLSFAAAEFSVGESAGAGRVTVRRTSGGLGTVTVGYRVESGIGVEGASPAIEGADFVSTSGTLTFVGGQLTNTFDVSIIGDRLVEGKEVMRLWLTNVTGGASIGFRTNALLSIIDDDFYGNLGFSAASYFINEKGGSALITVTRVGGATDEVAVDFSAGLGSATENSDYISTNGTLIFAENVTSLTFSVPVLDDSELEANETIHLSLANFSKAPPGAFISATLTINDDEALSVPAGSVDTLFDPMPGPNDIVNTVVLDPVGLVLIGGEFTAVNGVSRGRVARVRHNGSLDSTFDPGLGANDTVHELALQDDGKLVVVGRFTRMGDRNWRGVARLTGNGAVDSFFDPGSGVDNPVYAVAVQADGKIVIGGEFSTYDSVARNRLARLLPNGDLDAGFNPGDGANGTVYAVKLQSDGRILVGGDFTQVNGVARGFLVRLNAGGTVDTSFHAGTGLDGSVRTISVQPDGRIVVGGFFTSVDGVIRNQIARLTQDGALDETFDPNGGADGFVLASAIQMDGRVVIGGNFTSVAGVPQRRIARLNADGTLDNSINFGSGANDFVASLVLQTDEQILIAGGFTEYDGVARNYLARIVGGEEAGPGVLALSRESYSVGEGTNLTITVIRTGGASGPVSVDLLTMGITAEGGFDYVVLSNRLEFADGVTVATAGLMILDDPQVEDSETLEVVLANPLGGAILGAQSTALVEILNDDSEVGFASASYSVNESAVGGVANILVRRVGAAQNTVFVDYHTLTGTATNTLDYLATNGTLVFGPGVTERTFAIRILEDIIVEGGETVSLLLSNVVGGAGLGLANATLTIVDNDFSPGNLTFSTNLYVVSEGAGAVVVTVLRTNGTTGVIGLDYATAPVLGAGAATPGLDYVPTSGRITFADGATMQSFLIPLAADDNLVEGNETFSVTISNPSDGSISGPSTVLVRIEDNEFGPGTLDPTFDPGAGADNVVRSVAVQADGKVLVGGAFSFLNFHRRGFVGRFETGGMVDTNFMYHLSTNCVVTNYMVTNIVFVPPFQVITNIIPVMETNCVEIGANAQVNAVATTVNGRIIVGGAFSSINGTNRNRVARLVDDGNLDESFDQPSGLNVAVNAVVTLPDGKVYLGGAFSEPTRGIVRLKANGSVDVSFDPGAGTDGLVNAVHVLSDERVLIGGNFRFVNGVLRPRIARLNVDGSVDIHFNAPSITNGVIYAITSINQGANAGAVIVGGDFMIEGSTNRHRIARFLGSGILDPAFAPGTGPDATVYCILAQPGGKVLIGGDFVAVNGTSRNRLARLNADGGLDPAWDPGSGANNTVFSMAQASDGRVVIGGAFNEVNGFDRPGVARLNGDTANVIRIEPPGAPVGGQLALVFSSLPGRTYQIDASGDLSQWTLIGTVVATQTTTTFNDMAAGPAASRFYRVREVGP